MQPKKATGSIGSWFATVEGETLPCVHEYWWVKGDPARRRHYHDKLLRSSPHNDAFVSAIRESGKVILTSDTPKSPSDPVPFKRAGYIAIWKVEDVEFDDFGLKFRFVDKLANLK